MMIQDTKLRPYNFLLWHNKAEFTFSETTLLATFKEEGEKVFQARFRLCNDYDETLKIQGIDFLLPIISGDANLAISWGLHYGNLEIYYKNKEKFLSMLNKDSKLFRLAQELE